MWHLCQLLLLLFLIRDCLASTWKCPNRPFMSLDPDVRYNLSSFTAPNAIQNLAAQDGPLLFIATTNHLYVLDAANLQVVQDLITGPTNSSACELCSKCKMGDARPAQAEDTDSVVLVMDPGAEILYSCGSSLRGVCFVHEFDNSEILSSSCLFRESFNSPSSCPDCVASPLGTVVTAVEYLRAINLYIASSVDSSMKGNYGTTSVSIRRVRAAHDGFADPHSLTVLPTFMDKYPIQYVYTFSTPKYVFFLTIQLENTQSRNYHSRLVRLSATEQDMTSYRELVLDCRIELKRRRRSEPETFNLVQAAHVVAVGKNLATEMNLDAGDLVLFATFAQSDPQSDKPRRKSALCAFPLKLIDYSIAEGMKKCCSVEYKEKLQRGLGYYQTESYCPQNVRDYSSPRNTATTPDLLSPECKQLPRPQTCCPQNVGDYPDLRLLQSQTYCPKNVRDYPDSRKTTQPQEDNPTQDLLPKNVRDYPDTRKTTQPQEDNPTQDLLPKNVRDYPDPRKTTQPQEDNPTQDLLTKNVRDYPDPRKTTQPQEDNPTPQVNPTQDLLPKNVRDYPDPRKTTQPQEDNPTQDLLPKNVRDYPDPRKTTQPPENVRNCSDTTSTPYSLPPKCKRLL